MMRFLPAGDAALLVELDDLDATLHLFAALQAGLPAGVRYLVPAARTVLVVFSPLVTDAERLRADVLAVAQPPRDGCEGRLLAQPGQRLVEIPVRYDGADLAALAAHLTLTPDELIERHTSGEYVAAFAGFAPGFVYLTGGHPCFAHVPRLASPRTRVPAGSVALAGHFAAIYPEDSPGGWQLIGTTPLRMWDLSRSQPAWIRPGDRVRFVRWDGASPVDAARQASDTDKAATAPAPAAQTGDAAPSPGGAVLTVVSAGLQTLFQDEGREGYVAQGVSVSGALDRPAMHAANRLVGNPAQATVLECAMGQLQLRCEGPAVVAVTGAPLPLSLTDASGQTLRADMHTAIALEPGDVLQLGAPSAGVRSYLAVRGGFVVAPVLGSCATDTLSGVGPRPLRAGDAIRVGTAIAARQLCATGELPGQDGAPALPSAAQLCTLDVVLGPRSDWFTAQALAHLLDQEWRVTPQANRVGVRLHGAVALQRTAQQQGAELPSEGTVAGALQVPADGQPVLFLADHPLTGGYPVAAVVARHHLALAGQLPVGARVRFRAIDGMAGQDESESQDATCKKC